MAIAFSFQLPSQLLPRLAKLPADGRIGLLEDLADLGRIELRKVSQHQERGPGARASPRPVAPVRDPPLARRPPYCSLDARPPTAGSDVATRPANGSAAAVPGGIGSPPREPAIAAIRPLRHRPDVSARRRGTRPGARHRGGRGRGPSRPPAAQLPRGLFPHRLEQLLV